MDVYTNTQTGAGAEQEAVPSLFCVLRLTAALVLWDQ